MTEEIKWWIILGYYIYTVITAIGFNAYLKRKTGAGIMGSIDMNQIPRTLLWIFILGIIGTIIVFGYPLVYLGYPRILELGFPISILQNRYAEFFGGFILFSGLAIELAALLQLGTSLRFYLPDQETALITTGIYAVSRNPFYLGLYATFFGMFFLLPSIVYGLGFMFFVVNNHFRILLEEQFLKERFGKEYEEYCRKTGRYF